MSWISIIYVIVGIELENIFFKKQKKMETKEVM